MKQFVSVLGVSALAVTSLASSSSFAMHHEMPEECHECHIHNESIDPLAEEVINIFSNTLEKNFTTEIKASIDTEGVMYDWDDNTTTYTGSYNSGDAQIIKNGDAYSIDFPNESISFWADGVESFYPIEIDASFSEKAILNFETFQFAGKFSIDNIDTHGNTSVSHITDGILEFVELFENKWIVVDFVEIESEFPEIMNHIETMKNDIANAIALNEGEGIYHYATVVLSDALHNGYATVEKNNNTYTVSFEPNSGDDIKISAENPLQVVFTVNNSGTINSIDIKGDVIQESSWNKDTNSTSINVNILFSDNSAVIVFPEITTDDWEVTNIIEMVLEFTKDDILESAKEREFFENLNAFKGDAQEAIDFIEKNGTENDKAFVTEYRESAKKLDRRIRLKDLRVLENYYSVEDWEIEYLAEDIAYSPYKDEYDIAYTSKSAFEELISFFQDNGDNYVYIPWDIYDEMNFSIKTRGDIIIALAKIRKSEWLMK